MEQRKYDEEFKRNAVELLLRSGRPLKPLARELGISDSSLREWRDTYLGKMEGTSEISSEEASPREMAAEIRRLRRDLDRVTQQREILKKALSILSDPPPGGMR